MQWTYTRTNRLLGLASAWAGGFWVIVIAWEPFLPEPHPILVAAGASAALVAVGSVTVLRLWPNALSICGTPSLKQHELRLAAGAALSYVALVATVAAVGAVTIFPPAGHKFEIVTLIALWLPLWLLPLGAAVSASVFSRRASPQRSPGSVPEGNL